MKMLREFCYKQLSQFDQESALNRCYDFFSISIIISFLYRIAFYIASYPNFTYLNTFLLAILSLGLISDLLVCIIFTVFLYLFTWLLHVITIQVSLDTAQKIKRIILDIVFFLSIFSFACIGFANIKIYIWLRTPLNYTMITSYLTNHSALTNLVPFINKLDYVAIIGTFAIYFGIKSARKPLSKLSVLFILIFANLTLSLFGAIYFFNVLLPKQNKHFTALYSNPVYLLVSSFIKEHNEFNRIKFSLTPVQSQSVALVDPIFLNSNQTSQLLTIQPTGLNESLNVVVFVLESVGKKYVFEKNENQVMAMPFLHELAKKSVWLENNYSGGNISALGQFSIFTGIYPNPTPIHFELQNDLQLPSIASWLGKSYDSFLVSASNNLYFSMGLNKTFGEYDNAKIIAPNEKLIENIFLNEHEGFKFFLNRLNKTDKPFLAVYWSGATHFPYKSYIDENSALNNHDDFTRYQQNLSLLDQEIKQTYELLKQKNVLDNTIFIVVGDHGEMFGQHQAVIHGTTVYEDEIKVPLLIYAPKWLKPLHIHQITSSTDILPTVLDILRIPHQPFLQGQSLLQSSQRKYIFIYGDNDDIACIDQHKMKMVISFANATCNTYNLITDPEEIHPLRCDNQLQKEAILKFRSFQPHILTQYNARNRLQLKRDN